MTTSLMSDFLNTEAAARLLERVGFIGSYSFVRLAGGANNRVYRVDAPQRTVLLKSYFRHPGDRRDRCGAEWSFATAVWNIGMHCIPEPLACDPEHRLSLFEYIPGRRLLPQEVNRDRVREASTFFLELNSRREETGLRALPAGSEACFRLHDHLSCLGRRIDRLGEIDPIGDVERAAAEFVTRTLRPLCGEVLEQTSATAANAGLHLDGELAHCDRCVSPSDFGFHNALLGTDGTLKFIDFEYAGWDDPARTICDFFCQPELPVPMDCWDLINDEIARQIENADGHRLRAELLLPVYRLKWCCIMLNDFLSAGNDRRRFAGTVDETERKWKQLEKARQAAEQFMHGSRFSLSESSAMGSAA